MIVKPETLIGWHRKGFKLFWRWKSRLGRPRIPGNLRQLIVRLVQENSTWGEERIAAELSVKLGILVSPRTVRAYWPQQSDPRSGRRTSSQHWRTFVRNHAKAIVASDFLVAITAGFRVLYVFVVMEVGSRRILQCNVTAHPTAAWTLQQLREAIPSDHNYRFLIHDRDSIFSAEVDEPEGFTITGEDGKVWELHRKKVQLADHVGHTVTVTGSAAKRSKAEEEKIEANEKKEAAGKEHGDLKISSLKMVSDSCK
jgi:hypothetical protein